MALTQPLATLFGSGLSAAAGLAGNSINADNVSATNAANYRMQQSVNQTNMQIADKTNAANKELAELAYTRSLPVQQVNNMMAAGMSRGAALQALSGGGSYTAPVMQGATAQASQNLPKNFDVSALLSAFERIGNIPMVKQQSDLVQEQINSLIQQKNLRDEEEKRAKAEELRKQDLHERELYSHNENKSYDKLRTALDVAMSDKGISYKDIKDMDDLRNLLKDSDSWKNSVGNARERLFSYIRANQESVKSDTLYSKQLQEYADKHKMSIKQLKQLDNALQLFDDESDVRAKQRAAATALAELQKMANDKGIMIKQDELEAYTSHRSKHQLSKHFNDFWDFVSDIIGVNKIGDIIRIALAKS